MLKLNSKLNCHSFNLLSYTRSKPLQKSHEQPKKETTTSLYRMYGETAVIRAPAEASCNTVLTCMLVS